MQAGLATLTHTPSPMGFLNEILGRPKDIERPFLLLVVGYPGAGRARAGHRAQVAGRDRYVHYGLTVEARVADAPDPFAHARPVTPIARNPGAPSDFNVRKNIAA